MKRSRIVGTGSFVPARVVGNEEVAAPLGVAQDQILALTGIRTRHWAEQGQASSDLAVVAGQRACDAAAMAPHSLDAILVSTTSPDSAFPSTAAMTRHERICPLRIMTSAIDNPYRNPEQEAERSNAITGLAPKARCT